MAECRIWWQGNGRLYFSVAAGTFLAGILISSFLFPPAHAKDVLVDLKASLPLTEPEPTGPAPEAETSAALEQQSSDERLIALLSSTGTGVEPRPHIEPQIQLQPEPQAQKKQWSTVRMKVTGYCACSKCCGVADGITANNHRIRKGDAFVAADKRYRFGTEMIIPGYNSERAVKVMDRGGAIQGDHLDLFFHSHNEARQWGVQYLDVQIKTN